MLSVTPIIDKMGEILLNKQEAALALEHTQMAIKKKLEYFETRNIKFYHVPMVKMCLGATEHAVMDAVADVVLNEDL